VVDFIRPDCVLAHTPCLKRSLESPESPESLESPESPESLESPGSLEGRESPCVLESFRVAIGFRLVLRWFGGLAGARVRGRLLLASVGRVLEIGKRPLGVGAQPLEVVDDFASAVETSASSPGMGGGDAEGGRCGDAGTGGARSVPGEERKLAAEEADRGRGDAVCGSCEERKLAACATSGGGAGGAVCVFWQERKLAACATSEVPG
jgi:hypothetical protein